MAELASLGFGKTMQTKLCAVGICTAEELAALGSEEAALRLLIKYPNTCVVVLYYLEAALQHTDIKNLNPARKQQLKTYFARLTGKGQ